MFGLSSPWLLLGVGVAFVLAAIAAFSFGHDVGSTKAKLECETTITEMKDQIIEKNNLARELVGRQRRLAGQVAAAQAESIVKEAEFEAALQNRVDEFVAQLNGEGTDDELQNLSTTSCRITESDAGSLRQF